MPPSVEIANITLPIKHAYKPPQLASEERSLLYTSQKKLRRLVRSGVVAFGLISLLAPILVMYFVHSRAARVVVVCVSIAAFAIAISLITTATNSELMAAIAGWVSSIGQLYSC